MHIHAIGDGAVRLSLDAFAAARAANGARDARHQIAHLEMIDTLDVPRFAQLGVLANFQSLWAFRDSYIRDLTEPVLGPERSSRLYPIGSVARAGGTLVGGSDWIVSSMNPFEAMQVAVTRRDPFEGPGAPWNPKEAVSLEQILTAYTINGARANFQERETGSIETGKAADLVLLDRDLFADRAHRHPLGARAAHAPRRRAGVRRPQARGRCRRPLTAPPSGTRTPRCGRATTGSSSAGASSR